MTPITFLTGGGRNKNHTMAVYEGQGLRISQVTKRHMGTYLCIASNGVPPAVSKRIVVTVLCKSLPPLLFSYGGWGTHSS